MRHVLLVMMLFSGVWACSARSYTHYLVEPAAKKHPAFMQEEDTLVRPMAFGSTTVMKVTWNNGDVITEVQLPMLASGQRIIVEHTPITGDAADQVKTLPATKLVPPRPSIADTSLVEAYRARGLRVNEEAPDVSITGARTKMEVALKAGNYQVALEWCELVLARYPSHPEFMRAKGSILVLMGEREKAIEVYEAVEELESDAGVRQMLEKLRQGEF